MVGRLRSQILMMPSLARSWGRKISHALWVVDILYFFSPESSCMRKKADSAFVQMFYDALRYCMSSSLKRCRWLASLILEEALVRLQAPQLVAVAWQWRADWWVGNTRWTVIVSKVIDLKIHSGHILSLKFFGYPCICLMFLSWTYVHRFNFTLMKSKHGLKNILNYQ